jgi:hypothetical protein
MLYRLRRPEPSHLNDAPRHCHWCTGMIRGLHNIYKGQNCSRTIALRGVLEREKNEPRGTPSPALAFMQKLQPKRRDGRAWQTQASTVQRRCPRPIREVAGVQPKYERLKPRFQADQLP